MIPERHNTVPQEVRKIFNCKCASVEPCSTNHCVVYFASVIMEHVTMIGQLVKLVRRQRKVRTKKKHNGSIDLFEIFVDLLQFLFIGHPTKNVKVSR